MKGTSTLLFILLCCIGTYGQSRTVSGRLTSSENGEPLPGVNVTIKGTDIGTVTDADGYYSITAPVGSTLVFSFIGMQTREVVVTAESGNDRRPKKKLERQYYPRAAESYFVSDTLPKAGNGVGVLLPGTPSYKGSAPVAINTLRKIRKSGRHYVFRYTDPHPISAGYGVQYTTAVTADRVFNIPRLQKTYAQGRPNNGNPEWSGPDSGRSFAWGPAIRNLEFDGGDYPFDLRGRLVPRGSGNGNPSLAYDPTSIYKTGWTFQNSLAISAPVSSAVALVNLENLERKGVLPTSSYRHTNLTARMQGITIAPRVKLSPRVFYNQSEGNLLNRGSNVTAVTGNILLTPPTFDNANGLPQNRVGKSSDSWLRPDGGMRSFAPGIADNPFALVSLIPDQEKMKRLMGQMNVTYHGKDYRFRVTGNGSADQQWNDYTNGVPAGLAMYTEGRRYSKSDDQLYANLSITPEYSLNRGSSIKASTSYQMHHWSRRLSRQDEFRFDENFAFGRESADSTRRTLLNPSRTVHEIIVNGSFDNNYWLILRGSLKTYFSNTLRTSGYTNFFPSLSFAANLAEVFYSDAIHRLEIFGSSSRTLRQASLIYGDWSYASSELKVEDYMRFFENRELVPDRIMQPEIENKFESGLRLEAWRRLSFQIAWYNNTTRDFIAPAANIEGVSLRNVATLNNYGASVTLGFKSYRYQPDFQWGSTLTWSANRSIVRSLNGDFVHIPLGGFQTIQTVLAEGEPLGSIWGTSFERNGSGELIIGEDGFPIENFTLRKIGNPVPDWTLGWNGYANWRNISCSFVVDIKKGGDVWNGTRAAMDFAGMSEETERLRNTRDYIFAGVTSEGNLNNIAVDFYDANNPVESNRWMRYGFDGVGESYIEDASWIRLQDVTITYSLGRKLTGNVIKGVRFSVTARNLILITPYSGVDPATSLFGYTSTAGLDLFNSPATRSYNAQITLKI